MKKPGRALILCTLLLGFGCNDNDKTDTTSTQNPGTASDASVFDAGATNGGATDGGATDAGATDAGTSANLSEAAIAAVVSAANTGEIQQGQLALQRAQRAQVRDFANMMVVEHSAAQQRTTMLFTTSHISPAQNAVSQALTQQSMKILQTLRNTTSASFDLAYMDSQVSVHSAVLKLLTQRLIPSARSAALKTELQAMRKTVQTHLTRAQTIREQVRQNSDAGSADAGTARDAGSR
jgi:putative membrane protein